MTDRNRTNANRNDDKERNRQTNDRNTDQNYSDGQRQTGDDLRAQPGGTQDRNKQRKRMDEDDDLDERM